MRRAMNPLTLMASCKPLARFLRFVYLVCGAALVANVSIKADEVEAISSRVSKDYVRKRLPDGTFQIETYAFGKGDNWGGARVDESADAVDFMTVARTISGPLANHGYIPTHDQKTANLLVMVYWGTTRAPMHAAEMSNLAMVQQEVDRMHETASIMLKHAHSPAEVRAANQMMAEANNQLMGMLQTINSQDQRREQTDMKTATLLGYDSEWVADESASGGSVRGVRKQDMMNELEEDRYFVVLMAYDFQQMATKKKSKLLWEVHFSIREQANQFDKSLASMAANASDFFGTDSHGLQRVTLPEGKVDVGPVRSLGVVAGK
jgi:hypothetical protein